MRLAVPTLSLLLALAVSSAAVCQENASQVQAWRLPDGTSLLLVEDHRAPLIEVRIELPAGTWSPWVRENHAEEAFEIQMFDAKGELRSRADALALDISAWMGDLASTLSLSCHKDDLGAAIGLVRDVLANRDFDRRELVRRRQRREIGWQAFLKDPWLRLGQASARLLFERDDPRRIPHEKPETLLTDTARLALIRDSLVRLPGRTVGFAGDLTREEAERLATGLLPPPAADPPPGLKYAVARLTPVVERPREQVVEMPRLTQVYFACTRESLGYLDPDYAASLIADHELGGNFYSRLSVALRHEGGETYGAGVLDNGGIEPGIYALYTFTRAGNASVAEEKITQVLRRFHAEGITEQQRASAAGFLVGRRAFSRQSPGQILDERLWERRNGLPEGFKDRMAEKASTLSLDEINAFIRRFHDPARFTMIRIAPEK